MLVFVIAGIIALIPAIVGGYLFGSWFAEVFYLSEKSKRLAIAIFGLAMWVSIWIASII